MLSLSWRRQSVMTAAVVALDPDPEQGFSLLLNSTDGLYTRLPLSPLLLTHSGTGLQCNHFAAI